MQPDPALAAVKTYRYLRLALVALVILLFTAVALEWSATGARCVQGSISAYYYTPVQPVLVGVLVTMGVCLVALKGNTEVEDVLLNVAGMLAPGVAFVPTTEAGTCRSVPLATTDVPARVADTMQALFVTGALIGVAVVVIARREAGAGGLGRWDRLGPLGTALLLGGGAVWFYVARTSFLEHAHGFAAVPMFVCIVGVVWLNGHDVRSSMRAGVAPARAGRYVATYRALSTLMLVSLVVTVLVSLATGSSELVLWVEVVLIVLFAVFWLVQTTELWDRGLRRGVRAPAPAGAPES
ncbi:hypothetical protein [Nostocoides sp. Soil756]|uniref:hypothetical protein n=1 Tax=Nostocoides sp. Soil756 TaxID=1736399 RepID=UPI0006F6EEE9|nr:hypothetical protein [Tetrasphaera sp. Soil756]KRE62852.1 hypothetical protein ASG78_07720 [Tetrasphaera sp. Soil756]